MTPSQPSDYVPVKIPCTEDVHAFVAFNLPMHEDMYLPDRSTAVGFEVLRVLRQKSKCVSKNRIKKAYDTHFIIGVRENQLLKFGTWITDSSLREMNLQLESMLRERLHHFLLLNMKADDDYRVKDGINFWMTAIGIDDSMKKVDAYYRTFRNWRLRNHPEMMKKHGRPSRPSKWHHEKMFLESFPLNQHSA
jgi:hypothetical protein